MGAVFLGEAVPLSSEIRSDMDGSSWHEELDCPCLDSLAMLTLSHVGFDGRAHRGELVVASAVAADVIEIFRAIFEARFPIERMVRIDAYGGSDDASMAANNTSAFNCRQITGGSELSDHSFGTAIDINPIQNPYVKGGLVLPDAGGNYLDREHLRPGMLRAGGPVVTAFIDAGWQWGGEWQRLKDYHHFYLPRTEPAGPRTRNQD